MKDIPYKCEQTIDLEDFLKMSEPKPNRIKYTVLYNSGRIEEFVGKIKADGLIDKDTSARLDKYKKLTTIKKISHEKFYQN